MFEFKKKEIIAMIIAFLVLSFCFANSNVGFDLHAFISVLPIVMIGAAGDPYSTSLVTNILQ